MRGLLARAGAGQTRVGTADSEVHPDEMCGCGCATCGERRGRRGVGAIRRVTLFARQSCQGGRVGAERRDLEGRCGRGFELLLEREVSPSDPLGSGFGIPQCRERVLPDTAIRVCELDGSLADGVRLGGDTRGFVPCQGQRATIATSRAENATVSAAAEPPPGARPSADSRSRRSPSRSSR